MNSLHDAGYSKRTIEIVHSTMYNAMSKAVTIDKLQKNPCEGVSIKGLVKKKELPFIDSGNIAAFLTEAYRYGYIYWLFFRILIKTGMRKGEAAHYKNAEL
nr:integrase [Domibacillus mangrovi]